MQDVGGMLLEGAYLPAGHCGQSLLDVAPAYTATPPTAHAPLDQEVRHVELEVAPTDGENLPAAHSSHVPAGVVDGSAHVPAPHGPHAVVRCEHSTHADTDVAPTLGVP